MAASTKTTAADVEAFASGLDEFTRALRTARGRFNRAPVVPELSASQFHLLEPLAANDEPLAVCALAEAAGVAPPTATRMLDGLVKRGLAERVRPEEGDRRRVDVTLTPAGRELVTAKRERIDSAREQVFMRLSPGERKAAARLLHSLAAAIDELHP
ncbi:MAG: MarR family transcriptional regulator [Thermoleophilaceae bacterium]|nr:MarR family transcriptional regulator [Thermoleophilaceae bacterium]